MKELIDQELLPTLEERAPAGKWKPYEEYKDSGVEWLGEIPAHWETWKIAHAFKIIGSGTTPQSNQDDYYDEKGIPWITTSELRDDYIYDSSKKVTKRAIIEVQALKVYPPQTLLIAMYGATIGRVGILKISATVNQACCALSGSMIVNMQFLFYWFLVQREKIVARAVGGGQPNINQEFIRSLRIPTPPLLEQRFIATFLDRQLARINQLIARKERLVALLQERRTAIINQAVTRGLEPNAPMKDSGAEWLGEIPAHWEVRKLKYAATLLGGGTPSKANEIYWSGDIPWVSPKDMKSEIILDSEDHISSSALASSTTNLIPSDAVLLVVRSGILKHSIPVAINQVPVTINQDIKAILPKNILLSQFLAELIQSHQKEFLVEWRKAGATVESIEYDLLINTSIPLPPVEEQKAIVHFIQQKVVPIDKLISVIQDGIKKLKEYSEALISAAVTGKIDVRGEVAGVDGGESADSVQRDGAHL